MYLSQATVSGKFTAQLATPPGTAVVLQLLRPVVSETPCFTICFDASSQQYNSIKHFNFFCQQLIPTPPPIAYRLQSDLFAISGGVPFLIAVKNEALNAMQ